MTNYTKTTDFAAKDSLPSGDSGKIIRGTEFETEFDNIATAVNSKSDANNPTFTGTVTIDGLTVNGNTVLGNAATDTVTVTADIASNLIPSADDTYNLGAVGAEWNDLFIDGVANIDSLVADTADINGGTVDGVTIGGSSAGAITGTTITGTSFVTSGDMTFGDYDKAVFGAGSDLQIYHSGLHSYITDTGAGNLYLGGSDSIWLGAGDLSETYATFNDNGAVTLRHDNAPKLATTSTGIDVTGTATMDGLTVDGTLGNWSVDTQGAIQDFSASGTNYIRATNAAGSLRFGSGGVNNRLNIANNGDVSLYEDTGTTAKFFWDSSAESLGIGTSSPDATLHANKTAASGDAPFIFENSGTSGTCTSSVVFAANGGGGAEKARIKAAVRGDGYMAFHTNNDTEKMRIDSSGNVGIGTSSPSTKLHIKDTSNAEITIQDAVSSATARIGVYGAGGSLTFDTNSGGSHIFTTNNRASEAMRIDSSQNLLVGTTNSTHHTGSSDQGITLSKTFHGLMSASRSGAQPLILNRQTSDGAIADFRKDGLTVGSIGTNSGSLFIGSGDTGLNMRADLNAIYPWGPTGGAQPDVIDLGYPTVPFKDLYLSGGAYLGGTAAANKLDDYEEGTFTDSAALNFSTSGDVTATVSQAIYTKVGRLVHFTIYFSAINLDTPAPSGTLKVTGLPFTSFSGSTFTPINLSHNTALLNPDDIPYGGYIQSGSSHIVFTNGNATALTDSSAASGTNKYMMISGCYQAA